MMLWGYGALVSTCQHCIAKSEFADDPAIVRLYTHPITSWSSDPSAIPHTFWVAREPSLRQLTEFCKTNFHWNTEDVVKKHFADTVWPGALLQMMYSVGCSAIMIHKSVIEVYYTAAFVVRRCTEDTSHSEHIRSCSQESTYNPARPFRNLHRHC